MKLTPLFDPKEKGRPMRVAGFMSGSGTNIIKILEKVKGCASWPQEESSGVRREMTAA